MAKDFWMNGVQVKIWKGKVEGERTLLLCCVLSLCRPCWISEGERASLLCCVGPVSPVGTLEARGPDRNAVVATSSPRPHHHVAGALD